MSDYVLYHFERWQVHGIDNGENLRGLGIYAQNQYLVSNQSLTEGLIGVLPGGLAKGLCRVVSQRVCTMGLAKISIQSQSHFGKLQRGLESSLLRCTVFVKDVSCLRLVDAPILPRVW